MSEPTPAPYPNAPGEQPAAGYGTPPAYAQPGLAPWQTVPYASWLSRVGANILDSLVVLVVMLIPVGIGVGLIFAGLTEDEFGEPDGLTGVGVLGIAIAVIGYLAAFAFSIWNQVLRQGRTGQSLGKKWLGIQVVRADNGQFIGGGLAFLRLIMNSILGGICFLNYLWPLWDEKSQTWHDKVVGSVVITK